MTRSPRTTITALLIALAASWTVFGLGNLGATAQTQPAAGRHAPVVSQELFINLQSGREDLHRVNMAFSMARNQSKAGRKVTIFFNINAPEMATTGFPSALTWRSNVSIKDQVTELIGLGVTIIVCPMCSADQGVTAADLVPGASMSNPTILASHIKPGTVTMSY